MGGSRSTRPITNGYDANTGKPLVIGHAPVAPRPSWLPLTGRGQANVNPICWTISVGQWTLFVRACVATETWKALAEAKGEYQINLYDINEHFIKPWTQNTGCSIALLLNTECSLPAEGMFSHAWAGSVVETYNCMQNMVNHRGVPPTANFFYCAFSMYQPEDNAPGGLSISEQLSLEPFLRVIESEPKHGMFVIHTTTAEAYDRLWVAHEADVGLNANVEVSGLFDMYRWSLGMFDRAARIKTQDGKCGVEKDREYIHNLIMQRGGYQRLDNVIKSFRGKMRKELAVLLEPKSWSKTWAAAGADYNGDDEYNMKFVNEFDWAAGEGGKDYPGESFSETTVVVEWRFFDNWQRILDDLVQKYGAGDVKTAWVTRPYNSRVKEDRPLMHKVYHQYFVNNYPPNREGAEEFVLEVVLPDLYHPLGAESFPAGKPIHERWF